MTAILFYLKRVATYRKMDAPWLAAFNMAHNFERARVPGVNYGGEYSRRGEFKAFWRALRARSWA